MFFVCISFLLGVLFRWLGSELLRLLPSKEKGKKFLGYISCLDILERFLTVGSTTQRSTLPVTETHAPSYSSAENGLTGLIEKRVSEVFSFLSESCDVLEGVRLTGWLGKGTFSNVYKALWGTSEAALKVCQTTGETNLKQMLAMEVAVSFCSRHPNIVTSYKYAVHQKRYLQASAEPLDAPSGSCAQSDQAASQASAGHWSLASLGQRNVLEVQLLQECCDIGTLRSAIRKGFLHRVGEACTCEGGGGAASAEAETLGSPESIALLQMGRVPTAWKLGDGRDSAMCTAFERTVPGDRSLVGKPPPGGSEEQQQKLRASSMPRDNHQDMGMVLSIASDVVEGMIYLHSHGIVHGDIKSSNILLKTVTVDGEQRACAKISDFGTSVLLRGGEELTGFFAGTPSYMAPEVISRSTVSQASDVYSFGVLLFEMATGLKPYPGRTSKQIFADVAHHKLRPQFTVGVPRQLIELIASCWDEEPRARPTFVDIRARLHSISNELNLDKTISWVEAGRRARRVIAERASISVLPADQVLGKRPSRPNAPRRVKSTLSGCQALPADGDGSEPIGTTSIAGEQDNVQAGPPEPLKPQHGPKLMRSISAVTDSDRATGSGPECASVPEQCAAAGAFPEVGAPENQGHPRLSRDRIRRGLRGRRPEGPKLAILPKIQKFSARLLRGDVKRRDTWAKYSSDRDPRASGSSSHRQGTDPPPIKQHRSFDEPHGQASRATDPCRSSFQSHLSRDGFTCLAGDMTSGGMMCGDASPLSPGRCDQVPELQSQGNDGGRLEGHRSLSCIVSEALHTSTEDERSSLGGSLHSLAEHQFATFPVHAAAGSDGVGGSAALTEQGDSAEVHGPNTCRDSPARGSPLRPTAAESGLQLQSGTGHCPVSAGDRSAEAFHRSDEDSSEEEREDTLVLQLKDIT